MEGNSKSETQRKIDETKKQHGKQQQHQQVNESILRVSFLEQAATLLSNQNNNADGERPPGPSSSGSTTTRQTATNSGGNTSNLLGRLLLRELRECAFVDQLRMHRNFKRSHCKRCFQNWLLFSANDAGDCQIEVKARQGAIERICKNCGARRRFSTTNPNYRTRNEKAGNFE